MNAFRVGTLVLLMVLPDAAGQQQLDVAQVAIDKVREEMAGSIERLKALDVDDRRLAMSNQAQIDTTQMLKVAEVKILRDDIPEIKRRSATWDRKRDELVASGCPADGGEVPPPVAARCNPLIDALNEERRQILRDAGAIETRLATIVSTRKAVTETTLANVRKQKENATRREELEIAKTTQEGSLRRLYSARISEAVKKLELRDRALQACSAIADLEEAACCHQVVADGRRPAQCDVPLMYEHFERGGLFGTPVVRSRVRPPAS